MNISAEEYDLIVVGGGPVGCVAARAAAEREVKTLLLEKDRDFGLPVRCAEGLTDVEELRDFIEPDPRWIDSAGNLTRFVAPDGNEVYIQWRHTWAVLNRKVFDFELARKAVEAGVVVRNRCNAVGLRRENGRIRLEYEYAGRGSSVRAPLVIGADGVESRVGRWAGMKTHIKPAEIAVCFQRTIYHPDIDNKVVTLYFGEKTAPGGYAWAFPKGGGVANVGVGIPGSINRLRSAKDYLEDLISIHFPGASHLSSIAGAVPQTQFLAHPVADGVMLAGDAARQACPLTGAGLIWGMWGGLLAGRTAAMALERGDFSARNLSKYAKAWSAKIGGDHYAKYRVKKILKKFSDDAFNRTASLIQGIPFEKRTLKNILQTALLKGPGMLIDCIKLYFNN